MKKQKTPAENFSFKVSGLAVSVGPEKFVRPDLSRTGIHCYGLVRRKYAANINCLYLGDYKITSMVAYRRTILNNLGKAFQQAQRDNANRI
jgi:hypothetical protein